jgi:hypothetical protein
MHEQCFARRKVWLKTIAGGRAPGIHKESAQKAGLLAGASLVFKRAEPRCSMTPMGRKSKAKAASAFRPFDEGGSSVFFPAAMAPSYTLNVPTDDLSFSAS